MTGIFPHTYTLELDRFGALTRNFEFVLEEGYTSLVGKNNSGKSSILQFLFRGCCNTIEIGLDAVCYIPSDREYIDPNLQNGDGSLSKYNAQLYQGVINSRALQYNSQEGGRSEIFKQIINHNNSYEQIPALNGFLTELGLSTIEPKNNQTMYAKAVVMGMHGSGNRNLLPILASLTDPLLKVILIDEPERGLEPEVQRKLRDLLVRESAGKALVVATHSHLFLNKEKTNSNVIIKPSPVNGVMVMPAQTTQDLIDIAYSMLGNSFQDLFLPGNFLVVEGASDQEICNRILELTGVPAGTVKVLSAESITKVKNQISAVVEALRPIATSDSPYSSKIVALVDMPQDPVSKSSAQEISALLEKTGRYFELTAPSLEEYLLACGIVQQQEYDVIRSVTSWPDIKREKTRLSKAVSARLTKDDLPKMETLCLCIAKAVDGAK